MCIEDISLVELMYRVIEDISLVELMYLVY